MFAQVYATEHPKDVKEKHPEYDTLGCDEKLSLEIPANPLCWAMVKNMVVVNPLPQFETALVDALDFLDRTKRLPDAIADTDKSGKPVTSPAPKAAPQ